MPNLPVAMIPGHPGAQSLEELRANVRNVTAQQVIDNLLAQPAEQEIAPEPTAREIVFRGTFEEVNAYFYEREWSDGLPIVPPTLEKIEEFLSFTDRASGRIARHSPAGKSRRDDLGGRRQWRDGRLPPGVHADSGCAG